jgi:hypothetical protein
MALMAKSSGGNYTPPPADTYPAVCVGVFDLGTQENQFGKPKQQVQIMWEIDCDKADGTHHTVSRQYTPSLHPKAEFRKLLDAWSGKKTTPEEEKAGFDVATLLGKPCQLQVIHNDKDGKTYANVGAVLKLAKGMEPMTPLNKPVLYSWDDHGKKIPSAVPEFVRKKIEQSLEWRGEMPGQDEPGSQDDGQPSLEEQGAARF